MFSFEWNKVLDLWSVAQEFVCLNSCVAPVFSFEWNKEVLGTHCINYVPTITITIYSILDSQTLRQRERQDTKTERKTRHRQTDRQVSSSLLPLSVFLVSWSAVPLSSSVSFSSSSDESSKCADFCDTSSVAANLQPCSLTILIKQNEQGN